MRLTRPHRLFGQDRETVEEAFPGDVVGLVHPGLFAIGDTLCAGEPVQFAPVPRFPPECFARIENRSTGRHKQFHAGLANWKKKARSRSSTRSTAPASRSWPPSAICSSTSPPPASKRIRRRHRCQRLSYETARWVDGAPDGGKGLTWPTRDALRTEDREGRLVALFGSDWVRRYAEEKNPGVMFRAMG